MKGEPATEPSPSPSFTPTAAPAEVQDTATEPANEEWPHANEQAFLDALDRAARENGSGIRGMGDDANLELGYAICADIANGMTPTDVVISLQPPGEETPISKVASPLVGAAEIYLCPDHD